MRVAITIFSQRLCASIREGTHDGDDLTRVLSVLTHLDPIDFTKEPGLGFLWIHEILNSSYQQSKRHKMASSVMRLLGQYHYSVGFGFDALEPAWIHSLLDFLSLNEKFCSGIQPAGPPPNPGIIALFILSDNTGSTDSGPEILLLLTSILSPTHPLQLRGLALKVFHRLAVRWSFPHMGNVADEDVENLLTAVGDPFQFSPHVPSQAVGAPARGFRLQAGEPLPLVSYSPLMAVDILIEFASSDLWRDHLHRSNFMSYEVITSIEKGRRIALASMLSTATYLWPEFLSTPVKITAAIRRLEELQCLNTAQVVIMWAWTTGVINPMDGGAWRSVEADTLRFHRSHGMGRLNALKRHITSTTIKPGHAVFLKAHYGDTQSPCRTGSVRQPVSITHPDLSLPVPHFPSSYYTDIRVSRVCQLMMLYRLFGLDPTTWKEAVGAEEVDEEMDVVPEHPTTAFPFADWACDYP